MAEPESFVAALAREAGAIALRGFRASTVRVKTDGTVVTDADREVEEFIRNAVLREFPGSEIIGEEGDVVSGNGLTWFIDPIDGTSMFSVGGPTWSVAVSVFDGDVPLCACVHCPALGETFYTSEGRLLLNGSPVAPRPFRDNKETVLYASSNFATDYRITGYSGKTRNLGSGCLHQAYVFSGRGDAAILRGHSWDVASGIAFAEMSGGKAIDLDMRKVTASRLRSLGKGKTESPVLLAATGEAADYFAKRITYREPS